MAAADFHPLDGAGDMVALIVKAIIGQRPAGSVASTGCSSGEYLAIKSDVQRGVTGKTGAHGQDERPSSGSLRLTCRTQWTAQIALQRLR